MEWRSEVAAPNGVLLHVVAVDQSLGFLTVRRDGRGVA